jgi:YceI-like protein
MMCTSRSLHALLRHTLAAGLLCGLAAVHAEAQARWTADRRASLAWWQINPHLNHLWATTCPEEPSWRPGEGRSSGWVIDRAFRPPKQGYAGVSDTTIVPLYPRPRVRSVCAEAVEVEVSAADTVRWRGVRGHVVVKADALVGGENRRDAYAREAILQTNRYPDIRFTIDSLVGVSRQADTLRGTAVGVFVLHGVSQPMTASVRAFPEAGGLRVLGKFRIPTDELVPVYNLSRFALGLGVGVRVWHDLFMGVDLLLRPEGAGAN